MSSKETALQEQGFSITHGYVDGVYTEFAEHSTTTDTANDYDTKAGNIKEKFDEVDNRLRELGF